MKITPTINNTNFGLRKSSHMNVVFNIARKYAREHLETNPNIVQSTEKLIKRIEHRAPKSTLVTTGADFRLYKNGTEFYMTDLIEGDRLIPSLENLDYKLSQFDKAINDSKFKKIQRASQGLDEKEPKLIGELLLRRQLGDETTLFRKPPKKIKAEARFLGTTENL